MTPQPARGTSSAWFLVGKAARPPRFHQCYKLNHLNLSVINQFLKSVLCSSPGPRAGAPSGSARPPHPSPVAETTLAHDDLAIVASELWHDRSLNDYAWGRAKRRGSLPSLWEPLDFRTLPSSVSRGTISGKGNDAASAMAPLFPCGGTNCTLALGPASESCSLFLRPCRGYDDLYRPNLCTNETRSGVQAGFDWLSHEAVMNPLPRSRAQGE
jgi:hypothetical protein